MSLDPHHCFNFWGASPALDLKAAVSAARASASPEASTSDETPSAKTTTGDDDGERDPLTTLLLGTSDPRHVFTTLARSRRGADKDKALVFYVHEAHVVELARQVLLVSVLASDDLPPTDRTERILEIWYNCSVRDSTAELIERHASRLSTVVGDIFAGDVDRVKDDVIARAFDFSLLKYKEKDALMECFRQWSRKVPFDMELAFERRCRKYYGNRYDHRTNMHDWDYHMRVEPSGATGIHFRHFSQWRTNGVGYPIREATYPAPNRTLVSYARGTTKEYKDRDMTDKGRTIESRGYWGDILNSPYACFGVEAEDARLFKVSNRQHVKNAVEVSDYNVAANLFELRTGRPWKMRRGDNGDDGDDGDAASIDADEINAWMPSPQIVPGDDDDAVGKGASWDGHDGAVFRGNWDKVKIVLVGPDDFEKSFLGKKKHEGIFDAIVVGAWRAQLVTPALAATTKADGGVLILEGAKYMVSFDLKACERFASKGCELAIEAGFEPTPEHVRGGGGGEEGISGDEREKKEVETGPGILPGVDSVHRVFVRKVKKAADEA